MIALAQDALTVGVGDTSPAVTVSATAMNGFASAVSVAVSGLPAGASTSPQSPFSLAPGSTQDVTVTIPVAAAGG